MQKYIGAYLNEWFSVKTKQTSILGKSSSENGSSEVSDREFSTAKQNYPEYSERNHNRFKPLEYWYKLMVQVYPPAVALPVYPPAADYSQINEMQMFLNSGKLTSKQEMDAP